MISKYLCLCLHPMCHRKNANWAFMKWKWENRTVYDGTDYWQIVHFKPLTDCSSPIFHLIHHPSHESSYGWYSCFFTKVFWKNYEQNFYFKFCHCFKNCEHFFHKILTQYTLRCLSAIKMVKLSINAKFDIKITPKNSSYKVT